MKITCLIVFPLLLVAAGGAAYLLRGHTAAVADAPKIAVASEPDVLRYPAGAPQLTAIRAEPLRQVPLPLAEPLNAQVVYDEDVTARISAPIAGRVLALKAQPGDRVTAGQALLVMDAPDLGSAVADMDKARADEVQKRLALERTKTLYSGEALARKDLEAAEADYAAAQAETRRASLRLKNLSPGARLGGEGYVLRSPIAGVVADRQVNPGMEISPGMANPLFVVSDPTRLWVMVDLPEKLLSKVAPGNPVSIQVDAYPDTRFAGRIAKIAPALDPQTRRVSVRCSVDNRDGRLKPAMFARVSLLADADKLAFRVPNAALVSDGLYSYVFVEQSPGVLKKRRVSLAAQEPDYSYIVDGLRAGERVVTSGALLLNSELGSTR